tara:strand:+ start:583 stop:993 length:411 start_codon:yes stop_codon:yes gene_type:complete
METSFAWSLCISVIIVLISIAPLTYGRLRAGYSIDNMSAPRALFDQLPAFGKRAVWCHQNCWESITLHAPACLLCLVAGVVSPVAVIASWVHPFVRVIYIGAYIGDVPLVRGLCWATGVLCSTLLYIEGLTTLISS